jgi:hypothetical protein
MEALKAFAPQAMTSKVGVRVKLLQDLLSCSHFSTGEKPPGGKKGNQWNGKNKLSFSCLWVVGRVLCAAMPTM